MYYGVGRLNNIVKICRKLFYWRTSWSNYEKKKDSNRDIAKDFYMLHDMYGVSKVNILLLANIVYNLYDYYFKDEE